MPTQSPFAQKYNTLEKRARLANAIIEAFRRYHDARQDQEKAPSPETDK